MKSLTPLKKNPKNDKSKVLESLTKSVSVNKLDNN